MFKGRDEYIESEDGQVAHLGKMPFQQFHHVATIFGQVESTVELDTYRHICVNCLSAIERKIVGCISPGDTRMPTWPEIRPPVDTG